MPPVLCCGRDEHHGGRRLPLEQISRFLTTPSETTLFHTVFSSLKSTVQNIGFALSARATRHYWHEFMTYGSALTTMTIVHLPGRNACAFCILTQFASRATGQRRQPRRHPNIEHTRAIHGFGRC